MLAIIFKKNKIFKNKSQKKNRFYYRIKINIYKVNT